MFQPWTGMLELFITPLKLQYFKPKVDCGEGHFVIECLVMPDDEQIQSNGRRPGFRRILSFTKLILQKNSTLLCNTWRIIM